VLEVTMPAITADPKTLDRLPRVDSATQRQVRQVASAPTGLEGEGFPVRRAFAGVTLADLDPFVHMDQMGEVQYAPGEPKGTPWHPHRGFETVTYMIDGRFEHQDSNGGGGLIENGATQWMTAGAGILHIETPPEELVVAGGLFHGVQLWVNLPARSKWVPPAYQGIEAEQVAMVTSSDASSLVRIIAGEIAAHRGPGGTHTPMAYVHATVPPGEQLQLPWNAEFNALVYVLAGAGTVGAEARAVGTGNLAVFGPGESIGIRASDRQDSRSENLEVLVLGGEPIREPVEMYGPFVMNTKAELGQAMEDFQAGRLGRVPPNALMPHVPDPASVRTENTGI
jgi:redox-sensitive bicupin YhaK (pirin superfamily)